MSEKLQLEVFEKFIAVPGCTFTRTALTLDDNPSEETFRSAFGFLQTVDGCVAWWWGDLIIAHCNWDGVQKKDANQARIVESYGASKWAEMLGRETSTVEAWVQVAGFYPPQAREPQLSWAHHWEAKAGAGGDPAVAQDWLGRALKSGWSKTELRAAIRLVKRNATEPSEPMPNARMQELLAFNRWSRMQINRIDQLDAAELHALRLELEPAAKLIAAIDQLVKNE